MPLKLKELTVERLKNVDYGNIKLYDSNGFINVLGIYGQNGSGKTTVVNALEIIQCLLGGESIPEHSWGIFNSGTDEESLPKIFLEIDIENEFTLRYEVKFISDESTLEQNVFVANEMISYRTTKPYDKFKTLFEFSILEILHDPSHNVFSGTLKSKSKILSGDAIEMLTSSSMREHTSYLFSKDFKNRINRLDEDVIERKIYQFFDNFCRHMRIYTQQTASLTGMGAMPININYNHDKHTFQGTLPAILNKGGFPVPLEILPIYEETIKYMNDILPTIVPDLTIEMRTGEENTDSNGIQYRVINFFANRNDNVFSLIHESEGVKKIISMLGVLIEAFNNPDTIAVIDELDSGIFEYLLGELVDIFSKDAQGQLIFTSHNLRVLEMLPARQIRFSTINPNNRYIALKGIKVSNNLRDVYLRNILLGGGEEELYIGKSQSKIRRSLRKAGKKIGK